VYPPSSVRIAKELAVESTHFDGIVQNAARMGSRRQIVRALAAGLGMTLIARGPGLAARGIRPVRCFKRGDECIIGGTTECCGRLVCARAEDGLDRCQKVGQIKPE
jgi:hypothetical protein